MITREQMRAALLTLGPELLKPEYKARWTPVNPTAGYCYIVSEVLYHYHATTAQSYLLSMPGVGTHWWLKTPTGILIDWTSDQFDFRVPYAAGRRAAFFKGKVQAPRGTISTRGHELAKYLKLV